MTNLHEPHTRNNRRIDHGGVLNYQYPKRAYPRSFLLQAVQHYPTYVRLQSPHRWFNGFCKGCGCHRVSPRDECENNLKSVAVEIVGKAS